LSKEETIRKKLKVIEDVRKTKEKERAEIDGAFHLLRMMKLNSQMEASMKLVEMIVTQNKWVEDNIFAIWEEELKTELRLIALEKTVGELKQELEWREKNR
jgi:hypothetical protein